MSFLNKSLYTTISIFRFFDAVVFATPSCIVFPGETRLQAINKDLERLKMSMEVILDNDTGLELIAWNIWSIWFG